MAEARAETTIAKPADEVWATIGNFGELGWMPGVDSCELQGENLRVLKMFGMTVEETQLRRDEAGRSLTYGITGGDMLPERHEATITVTPQGDGSHVTWDVDTTDTMVEAMKGAYQGALDGLKAQLEG